MLLLVSSSPTVWLVEGPSHRPEQYLSIWLANGCHGGWPNQLPGLSNVTCFFLALHTCLMRGERGHREEEGKVFTVFVVYLQLTVWGKGREREREREREQPLFLDHVRRKPSMFTHLLPAWTRMPLEGRHRWGTEGKGAGKRNQNHPPLYKHGQHFIHLFPVPFVAYWQSLHGLCNHRKTENPSITHTHTHTHTQYGI